MSSIERTAFPRFPKKRKIKQAELNRLYFITHDELKMIKSHANTDKSRLNIAIQLKTFQALGYFITLDKVPHEVVNHIRQSLQLHYRSSYGYSGNNKSLYRHRDKIRTYLEIKRWEWVIIDGVKRHEAMRVAIKRAYDSSQTMNNIADIINSVVEGLIKESYELPSFYKLNRLVRHTRHVVNMGIFKDIENKLQRDKQIESLDNLLECSTETQRTSFNNLKSLPGRPTVKEFDRFLNHYAWIQSLGNFNHYFDGVAKIKIDQFAQEAFELSADEIKDLTSARRHTLILALIHKAQAKAKDAIGLMFCRLIAGAHKAAKLHLQSKLGDSKKETCEIASLLQKIIEDAKSIVNYLKFAKSFFQRILSAGGLDEVHEKCEAVLISHSNDYRLFISDKIQKKRAILLKIINTLKIENSNQNDLIIKALQFLLDNAHKRSEYLPDNIDLSFATDFWKNQIIKTDKKGKRRYKRRELESCILEYISKGLNSGDLYIDGASNYADYRAELMPWDECEKYLDEICEQANIKNNEEEMFKELKSTLLDKSKYVDNQYINQNSFVINPEDGRPVLKKYEPKLVSEHARKVENLILSRMPERSLFDIIINANVNVDWADEFGLSSGKDDKMKDAIAKYIITVFCFSTGLGATQTAKHVRYNISPRTISRINKKHVSIKFLEKATNRIINCLNQIPLLQAWGQGKSCAVDGTFEDIREGNMISEQHIRYGKKGGVAYRHIADNYIALFSTFIKSGTWEAIHIIDSLLKNASELKPEIVHGDTQAQSLPVYAFAYLLGIKLMPRIRNWKSLNMYKADKNITYRNIDKLFCDKEIDWALLKKHWKDLMQVIISVKYGKISSSFILTKLNSYNNQNKLYKAFTELGKVIRTNFLLDYIINKELRQLITDNTNKAETYHTLEDWIQFGSSQLTTSNNADEMEKAIKYCDLVGNCIMLQNAIDVSNICHKLKQEGHKFNINDLGHMSLYMTEHLKRFGEYVLNLNSKPAKLDEIRNRGLF